MARNRVERVGSKIIYRGRVAVLSVETFRMPGGDLLRRETIRHRPSAVILPVFADGRILLIRQFRHAVGRAIYELPAGTSEPREPLLSCAKRELAEETGYSARHWRRICRFYPAPGISTEWMTLYAATGLAPVKKRLSMDEDEQITVKITPAREVLEMVRRNQIIDAKSIIGILWGLNRILWGQTPRGLTPLDLTALRRPRWDSGRLSRGSRPLFPVVLAPGLSPARCLRFP